MMDDKILRIVYSEDFIPKKHKFSLFKYINAFAVFIKARIILKRKKILDVISYIDHLSKKEKITFSNVENEIYNARRVIKALDRLDIKHKHILCLEYSLCVCAALVRLGFTIDLFIGQSKNYVGNYNFHSWLEIKGTTINFRTNYREVYNIVYYNSF